jgi:predicted ferric reductase
MTKRVLIISVAILIALGSLIPLFIEMADFFDPINNIKRLFSLLAFVFMLYQIILTSRIPLLESSFAQDKMIQVHRILGIVSWVFLIAHGFLHIYGLISLYGVFELYLPLDLPVLNGIITLGILSILALGALARRAIQMKYDTWLLFHRITHFVFISGFIHALALGRTVNSSTAYMIFWYCLGGIYLLCLGYRIRKYLIAKRHPYLLKEKTRQSHDTYSYKLSGPEMDFVPGQFMYVSVALNGKKWERHPFTISGVPFTHELEFTSKAIGDFTQDIQDLEPGTEFRLDGPYGLFTHTKIKLESPLVFLAGGVGITPFLSMLRFMKEHDPHRTVVLIWGNKSDADVLFSKELEEIQAAMPNFSWINVFSDTTANGNKQSTIPIRTGYLDRSIFEEFLSNDKEYHYFICGPAIMQKFVMTELKAIGVSKKRIELEKFLF